MKKISNFKADTTEVFNFLKNNSDENIKALFNDESVYYAVRDFTRATTPSSKKFYALIVCEVINNLAYYKYKVNSEYRLDDYDFHIKGNMLSYTVNGNHYEFIYDYKRHCDLNKIQMRAMMHIRAHHRVLNCDNTSPWELGVIRMIS